MTWRRTVSVSFLLLHLGLIGLATGAKPAPERDSGAVLIFPQFVNGDGGVAASKQALQVPSRSRIILVNNSGQSDSGVICFQDENGEPSHVPIGGELVSNLPYTLGAWASIDVLTDGSGPLRNGVVRVFSERGVASQIEGTLTLEVQGRFVSVANSPLLEEAFNYITVDDSESTGIAVYNPDQRQSLALNLILRDEQGGEQTTKVLQVGANRSVVGFVTDAGFFGDFFSRKGEWDYATELEPSFRGVLEIRSQDRRPFAALTLVQKFDSGALIGSQPGEPAASNGHLVFPQFVDGDYGDRGRRLSSRTRIILIDPADDRGRITFRNSMGTENPLQIGETYAASLGFDTPMGGSAEFRSAGSGPLQWGTVEILSGLGNGSKLLAWEALEVGENFVTVTSAPLTDCQQTYVSVDGGNEDTGLAIYNPSETAELSLDLLLVDGTGAKRATRNIRVEPRHQLVAFVTEAAFFKEFLNSVGNSFKGTLNIRAANESPFALLGLLRKPSGALIGVGPSLNAYNGCGGFEFP